MCEQSRFVPLHSAPTQSGRISFAPLYFYLCTFMTMPKKIICTVINDLSYDQRMIRICTSLARAGYEVELVGRMKERSIPLRRETFSQRRLPSWFYRGKEMYLEHNLRLLFFLLFKKFDVLCAVDLDTIVPAWIVCRLRGKTLVYDAHEYFTELPEVVRRPVVQKVWESVARLIIPRVEYAYTVGRRIADELERRYSTPFALIRNVPPARALPTAPTPLPSTGNPLILLYQGVLNEGRGLEILIRSMQKLEDSQLWLAGEGDLSNALRTMAEELDVTDKVRFLGYIPPHQLTDITQQAHLGLNLLENRGLNYYYSLANKTFDYLQAGLPSIQMNFPEYRQLQEVYQPFLLLERLEEPLLIDLVEQIRRDPDHYHQLQLNCRRAAAELNWEKEEKKLLALYAQILSL